MPFTASVPSSKDSKIYTRPDHILTAQWLAQAKEVSKQNSRWSNVLSTNIKNIEKPPPALRQDRPETLRRWSNTWHARGAIPVIPASSPQKHGGQFWMRPNLQRCHRQNCIAIHKTAPRPLLHLPETAKHNLVQAKAPQGSMDQRGRWGHKPHGECTLQPQHLTIF